MSPGGGAPPIPLIDLKPFAAGDSEGMERVAAAVAAACQDCGFFRVVNHGVPSELMERALALTAEFFALPDDEKRKIGAADGSPAPLPIGYARQPANSPDKNEYLLLFSPSLGLNVYPSYPAAFKETMEECFEGLSELGLLLQRLVGRCLNLGDGFFDEYNPDRRNDFMAALRYFPADVDQESAVGLTQHEDGNLLTLLFQDEVGGLEVLKDGEWVAVDPTGDGSIVVNLGDTIQVLSNDKLKSSTHRVVQKGAHRHSCVFFLNPDGDKWVEPLPQFTAGAGEPPRYRGFVYKEYMQMRMRNKTHPPRRPEEAVTIAHYKI